MKKCYLVTGGAGFIGSNLVRELLKGGAEEVVVVDNLSSGRLENLPKNSRLKFYNIDISNLEKLSSLLLKNKFNVIFHLAAQFANQNSVDFPISDATTNIIGLINILELLRNNKPQKFIYTSSSCVYGSQNRMHEAAPVYPTETPYAISKYAGELYVKYYADYYGIPGVSLRIFNTYGPHELDGQYRNVVPKFIARALKGEDLTISGHGTEVRDFTYVSDTAKFLITAAVSICKNGEVFNCGTGRETTIDMLAKLIISKTNSASKIIYTERREWDHVHTRKADIEYSLNSLGYKSSVELADGIEKTIEWYKKIDNN